MGSHSVTCHTKWHSHPSRPGIDLSACLCVQLLIFLNTFRAIPLTGCLAVFHSSFVVVCRLSLLWLTVARLAAGERHPKDVFRRLLSNWTLYPAMGRHASPKVPLPVGDLDPVPRLIRGSLGTYEFALKRHFDWLIRFCTAHGSDQHTLHRRRCMQLQPQNLDHSLTLCSTIQTYYVRMTYFLPVYSGAKTFFTTLHHRLHFSVDYLSLFTVLPHDFLNSAQIS